jgi:negative regulator of sigma E activity
MNCPDVIARLADPSAAAEPEVRAHLDLCADCRNDAQAVEALAQTASSPSPEKLERFPSRVKARLVAQQERTQRSTPWRSGLVAGAVAAAATAAVALSLQFAFPTARHTIANGPETPSGEIGNLTPDQGERLLDAAAVDQYAEDLVTGDEYALADDEDDVGGAI